MGYFSCAGRTFSRSCPPSDRAGRTFSRTGSCDVTTLKPTTPLQPLMQANVKPPSPMLAPKQQPLKPPSPLQAKNAPKTPISHPQRRCRFQLGLGLREQRRWWFHLRLALREQRRRRFHARDFQCPRAIAEPGRAPSQRTEPHISDQAPLCGGRRRDRRARAGFEIDHSEPSGSRVAISRAAGPDGARNTSGATSIKLNREFRLHRRCEGRKRAWLRRPEQQRSHKQQAQSQIPAAPPV